MIELENVEVRYNGRPAVTVDELAVPAGEWLAVVGPNGAGKSSLLHAIVGMVPHSGTVRLGAALGPTDRRSWARLVAWVPQRPTIPAGMTVLDYVLLGRYAHLSYWAVEDADDVAIASAQLAAVDLAGFEDRDAQRLSGGEQQRMTIARALTQESPVLLLDEPTASLDLGHQIAVLELIDGLRKHRELTVVAAMHDLTLAARVADRMMLLVDGSPRATGSRAEILDPRLLSAAYQTEVHVLEGPDGSPVVVAG